MREVSATILSFLVTRRDYHEARVLERLTEPDRIIIFRVGLERAKERVDYMKGANITGFVKLADAIGSYGIM